MVSGRFVVDTSFAMISYGTTLSLVKVKLWKQRRVDTLLLQMVLVVCTARPMKVRLASDRIVRLFVVVTMLWAPSMMCGLRMTCLFGLCVRNVVVSRFIIHLLGTNWLLVLNRK